jgi:hypothetical protein
MKMDGAQGKMVGRFLWMVFSTSRGTNLAMGTRVAPMMVPKLTQTVSP